MDRTEFIKHLASRGGPDPSDYESYSRWVASLRADLDAKLIDEDELSAIRSAFGDALSVHTMQGLALAKPHGYAGDFEIIDRIYRSHTADQPHLEKWDLFFHAQAAPTAVRNRKTYFHDVLNTWTARKPDLRVLNVASGPGRCMYEWFRNNPDSSVQFHCVELDRDAIAFATELNQEFLSRIEFVQANVLRWKPTSSFDLIWAAGIFDYFPDSIFVAVIKRLLRGVRDGGELVIGNFAEGNPSRVYMETVGDWKLHHRTRKQLISLAKEAGVNSDRCRVDAEEIGVNLFLHITP